MSSYYGDRVGWMYQKTQAMFQAHPVASSDLSLLIVSLLATLLYYTYLFVLYGVERAGFLNLGRLCNVQFVQDCMR